ncbi:MAG: beta strand repeat-containing protein, partial [Bacteroidota bacterium]
MRVIVNEGLVTSPTMAISYGEREEYLVNISSANNGGGGNIPSFTYSWSDGTNAVGTTNPLSTAVNANTTFTVTASTVAGCTVSSSVAVTAIALPTAPTATNSVQCGPGVPTASVASNTGLATPQFRWYAAATGGTALQSGTNTTYGTSISTTTTLYVSEFDGTCESARTPVTITVNTPPSITSSNSTTICSGQSTTISVSSSNVGYAYTWSGGAGSGSSVTVSPLTTTTYTVTALDTTTGATNSGCTISATTTITVNTSPSALTIAPTTSMICNGASTTLNTTGGTNTGAYTSGAFNTVNSTTSYPAPLTNYYGGAKHQMLFLASELSALGYTANSRITSLGFGISAVGSTFSGTLNGFTIALKHTSASTLTTTFETGLTQVASLNWAVPTTGLPLVSFVAFATPFTWDGVSNLIIQTSYSNSNSGTTNDFVQTYLTNVGTVRCSWYRVDGASAATVLAATTATSTGTSRPDVRLGWETLPSYSWTPSTGLNTTTVASPIANPTATTTYTVTATNLAGCTAAATTTVTVNPLPTVSCPANLTLCINDAALTLSGASPSGGVYSGNGVSNGVFNPATAGAGTHTITYNYTDGNGCSSNCTFQITVNGLPSLAVTPSSGTLTCSTTSITLTASGADSYSWSNGATGNSTSVSSAGTYTVTGTNDATGCSTSASAVINSNTTAPSAGITNNSNTTTLTCTTTSISLTATGGSSYLWSTGATSANVSVTNAGTYTVTATGANGCTAT